MAAAKPFVLLPPELLHGLHARVAAAARRRQTAWSPAVFAACESHLRPGDMAVLRMEDRPAATLLGTLRQDVPSAWPGRSGAASPPFDPAARLEACYGLALAQRTLAGKGVVLVFAGRAEDVWTHGSAALQRCAAQRLPILFITETPLQESSPIAVDGSRPRLPRVAVDAHDTVAIYRVAQECIRMARAGGGPTWLDCQVVPPAATERRLPGPPAVARMQQYLQTRGLYSEAATRQAAAQLEKTMQEPGRGSVLLL